MSNQQVVPVPATSLYTIIFPQDFRLLYDSSFYNPNLTEGRATKEEIDQLLREIEAVKKPFGKKITCALWLLLLGFLASIAMMIALPIMSVGPSSYDKWGRLVQTNDNGELFGGIFGGLALMIFSIVYFAVYVVRNNRKSKAAVQVLLDRINPDFNSRGLRWHLPLHFPRWIELWKDYVGQPAAYTPPAMTQQYQNYPAPTGATYQMPGAQPQAYQNYGVQPQGHSNYNQQGQQFANYNQL